MARQPLQSEQIIHFLVFDLAGQPYGVAVEQTEGLVPGPEGDQPWTYRGQQVPLDDLARCLGLTPAGQPPNRVLLIRQDGERRGFLVPTPRDIVALAVEDIYPLPPLIRRALGESALLWGVGRREGELLLLVDLLRRKEGTR